MAVFETGIGFGPELVTITTQCADSDQPTAYRPPAAVAGGIGEGSLIVEAGSEHTTARNSFASAPVRHPEVINASSQKGFHVFEFATPDGCEFGEFYNPL